MTDVALDSMWLEPVLAPHARHHHVAGPQLCGEFTRGPMRRAARSPRQFHMLRVCQGDGVCHGRHYGLQMTVTAH